MLLLSGFELYSLWVPLQFLKEDSTKRCQSKANEKLYNWSHTYDISLRMKSILKMKKIDKKGT